MKHALAIVALMSAVEPSATWAANEPVTTGLSTESLTSVEKGKLRVGGGFNFSYSDLEKASLSGSASTEYFILERLSLGGTFDLTHYFYNDTGVWSLGPSATYYFWKRERVVTYLGFGLSYARLTRLFEGTSSTVFATTKLGMEYFITPSVSFGPAIHWRHAFQEIGHPGPVLPANSVSGVGQFSIYF